VEQILGTAFGRRRSSIVDPEDLTTRDHKKNAASMFSKPERDSESSSAPPTIAPSSGSTGRLEDDGASDPMAASCAIISWSYQHPIMICLQNCSI